MRHVEQSAGYPLLATIPVVSDLSSFSQTVQKAVTASFAVASFGIGIAVSNKPIRLASGLFLAASSFHWGQLKASGREGEAIDAVTEAAVRRVKHLLIASDLLLSGAALFLGFYFKSRPFHATGLALLAFGSLQLGLDKENPKRITDQPAETENRSVPEIEIPKYRKKITVRDPHWEWPERPDPIPDRAQLFVCRTEASEGTTVLVLSNEKRIPMNQFQALPLTPSLWEQEFPDRPFEEGNERLESDEYLIYWGPSFDQEKREMCEYRFWSVQEIEINTELPDFALNYESFVGTMEQGSDTSFLSLNDDVVTIEVSDDYPPNDLRSALLDVRYDYSDEVPSVSLKVSGPDLINAVNLLHSESGVPHDGGLPFNNLAPTVDIRCADGHCLIFGLSEKPSPLLQSYLQELVRIAFLVEPILPDS